MINEYHLRLKRHFLIILVFIWASNSYSQIFWEEVTGFNYSTHSNSLDTNQSRNPENYILSESFLPSNTVGSVEINNFQLNGQQLNSSSDIGVLNLYLTYEKSFNHAQVHINSYSISYYQESSEIVILGPNNYEIARLNNIVLQSSDVLRIDKTESNKIVLSFNSNTYLVTDNYFENAQIAILTKAGNLSFNIQQTSFLTDNPNPAINVVDSDKNWIMSKSYDNAGIMKDANITYYNGLGKETQSHSRNLKNNRTWVSEIVYDIKGRPALSTYPAMLSDINQNFAYTDNFLMRSNDNAPITPEIVSNDPENAPAVAESANTAGWYYSENNTIEPFQDIAQGRPYTLSVYDELNPGNIRGLVGGKRLDVNGNGNYNEGLLDNYPQGYEYTMRAAQELYYAFGKDYFDSYTNSLYSDQGKQVLLKSYKNVVIDAQGNEVITFLDDSGKVLGTARSGGQTSYEVVYLIGEQGYVDIHIPVNWDQSYELIGWGNDYSIFNIRTGEQLGSHNEMEAGGIYRITHPNSASDDTFISSTGAINRLYGARGIKYNVNYYDFSLNYYDDKGNLVKSTQPKGFNTDAFNLSTGIVIHGMASTFDYNAIGELTRSYSPDQGYTNFIYRNDGQIRLSRNQLQQETEYFSYTNYDELARPIESGISNAPNPYFPVFSTMPLPLSAESGVIVSGSSLFKNGPTGWFNSGFTSSLDTGDNNFEINFKFSENSEGVVGISEVDTDGTYTTVDYAFSFQNNQISIINNGSKLTERLDSYGEDDLLQIRREKGDLKFLKNDSELYSIPITDAVYFLDGTLYTQGAEVQNLELQILSSEKSSSQPPLPSDPDDWIVDPNTCREQIFTLYDEKDTAGLHEVLYSNGYPTGPNLGLIREQRFVSGNVSKTWTEEPETNTTWYSYDVYGRVEWMVQYINGLGAKTIDYEYDHATGELSKVYFQKYVPDERFVHRYSYDEIGQLVRVETSRDGLNFTKHAEYTYYESGELKRTVLAEGLQGVDYAYTLNGHLKSINHPNLTETADIGDDQNDAFGLILNYYRKDYLRTGTHLYSVTNFGNDRYDGNIKSLRWGTEGFNSGSNHNGMVYDYNSNSWLESAGFGSVDGNGNYTPDSNNDYMVSNLTYDANGNILTLNRNKNTDSGSNEMDILEYDYDSNLNQLNYVKDNSNFTTPFSDIKDQPINNYVYNSIGQLVVNHQDELNYQYYSNGLVKSIESINDAGVGNLITFYYDERGSRIKKDFWSNLPGGSSNSQVFYVRDASGKAIAIYTLEDNQSSLDKGVSESITPVIEYPIYGNSRLGIASQNNIFTYQLTDHLGNVRAVIQKQGYTSYIYSEDFSNITVPPPYVANNDTQLSIDTVNERLKVEHTGPAPISTVGIDLNVQAGHSYDIMFKVDLDETPNSLNFHIDDGTGSSISTLNVISENGEYSYSYTATSTQTVYATFALYTQGVSSITNNYYLDDIKVADITTTNAPIMLARKDYYPFGMGMPGRHDEGQYRYAYQGQEKDPETGMEAFELRLWDARIGRWLTVDPNGEFHSPYLGMGNNPIMNRDPDGGVTKDWKPIVNEDGTVSYVAELNDSYKTFSEQYGVSLDAAKKLVGPGKVIEGTTTVSGQDVFNMYGNEVLTLQLGSDMASDQRVIDQFIFAIQHSSSKGANAWAAKQYFGNVYNALQEQYDYIGQLCINDTPIDVSISVQWYESQGLFFNTTKHQAVFGNNLDGTLSTSGSMFGNTANLIHSKIEYGFIFDRKIVWQDHGYISFLTYSKNSGLLHGEVFQKFPQYNYINTIQNRNNN